MKHTHAHITLKHNPLKFSSITKPHSKHKPLKHSLTKEIYLKHKPLKRNLVTETTQNINHYGNLMLGTAK
jgi:hypothetical protein